MQANGFGETTVNELFEIVGNFRNVVWWDDGTLSCRLGALGTSIMHTFENDMREKLQEISDHCCKEHFVDSATSQREYAEEALADAQEQAYWTNLSVSDEEQRFEEAQQEENDVLRKYSDAVEEVLLQWIEDAVSTKQERGDPNSDPLFKKQHFAAKGYFGELVVEHILRAAGLDFVPQMLLPNENRVDFGAFDSLNCTSWHEVKVVQNFSGQHDKEQLTKRLEFGHAFPLVYHFFFFVKCSSEGFDTWKANMIDGFCSVLRKSQGWRGPIFCVFYGIPLMSFQFPEVFPPELPFLYGSPALDYVRSASVVCVQESKNKDWLIMDRVPRSLKHRALQESSLIRALVLAGWKFSDVLGAYPRRNDNYYSWETTFDGACYAAQQIAITCKCCIVMSCARGYGYRARVFGASPHDHFDASTILPHAEHYYLDEMIYCSPDVTLVWSPSGVFVSQEPQHKVAKFVQ